MKKHFYLFLLSMGMFGSSYAQTLLNESFEDCTQFPPSGWEAVNDNQPGSYYHWEILEGTNQAVAGKKCAYCNAGSYTYAEPAKEEWLITPEIQLTDQSYKLEFKWKGAWAAASKSEYDLQVRVSTDGGKTWNQIWSFLSKEQVQKSGLDYPWAAWTVHQPIIDLSAYKGEKIKIAFIHNKLQAGAGKGNGAWLDDILVEDYNPVTTPVVAGSTSYKFENIYIGASKYSEVMTLTNTGVDTLKILSLSGLEGTDFTSTIQTDKVKLGHNQSYSYQVIYSPTLTGSRTATLKIETNGGILNVLLEGTKKMISSDYTYEGFEGEFYPPLGWKKNGGWMQYNYGLSGDKCAAVSLSELSELITPRLDLSTGSHKITFDMLEYYEAMTDDSYGPENYSNVYFSKDGGSTWTMIHSNMVLNQQVHLELDLGTPASDNCYVKWSYELEGLDLSGGFDYLPEYSDWYIDDVILPPLYGRNGLPSAVTAPTPATGATDVFNQELTLSWYGTLFAQGYKLYLGKSADDFSVINGIDLGLATTYRVNQLDYNQKYYWKIVPYNAQGEATNIPVWDFTVMQDQSISAFPYFEGFEGQSFPTLGWGMYQEGNTKWSRSNYNPHDGTYSAMSSGNQSGTAASLQSPEIILPAGKVMQVSFYWGNSVPAGLTKMPRLQRSPAIAGSDTLYFEVKCDGKWNTIATISSPEKDNQKWQRERILLTDYAGKTINLRWRYSVANGMKSTGASLDNVLIEQAKDGSNPVLNKNEWNAGFVNYMKSLCSKNIFTLLNDGERDFTISEVKFGTNNFITSLTAGTHLKSREELNFSVTFSAGNSACEVNDILTIKCDDGVTITMPVKGTALNATTRYFGFEEDVFGSTSPLGFTTIDADGAATCRPVMINYPNYGGSFAYIVINHKPEPEGADWRNIYPVSGDQVLACMSAQNSGVSVEDWLISERMTARSNARFRFFAKSYGSDFERHKATVMISTTNNSKSSFTPLSSFTNVELPAGNNQSFTEFTVDLSAFAGQTIYVALRHTVSYDGFVAFFDDLFYENFDFEEITEHAPQFITEPEQVAYVGKPYAYNFAATCPTGGQIGYNIIGIPDWMTHTPSETGGVIAGTPAKESTHMFRIAATEGTYTTNQDVILEVKLADGLSETTVSSAVIFHNQQTQTVYVKGIVPVSVSIYTPDGRLLRTVKETESIDVSDLNEGIYTVRVITANGSYATNISKK